MLSTELFDPVRDANLAAEERLRFHQEHSRAVNGQAARLAVPLSQLKAIGADASTQEAIGDWHYWVAQGCTL